MKSELFRHGGNVPHARSRRVAADRTRRPSAPYGWYWATRWPS